MNRTGLVWTVVGVLLIIVLVIVIVQYVNIKGG